MAKYVIIGGVAGGMTAAARLRRLDEKSQIIVLERGEYVSYANCGLPYYIGGTIEEREKLVVQTPQVFLERFNIDVRLKNEAIHIDRNAKKVLIKDLKNNKEYSESYDKLILSPGAEPVIPPINGIKNPRIFTLRNIPDTDRIKEFIQKNKPKRALIVGAGFIGLEMAENLKHAGIFVTVVEMSNQVMNVLDYEMAALVSQHLKIKGVEFYLNESVSLFGEQGEQVSVRLSSGRNLLVDFVILSIGVRPETHLAKECGLMIGSKNGILVNDYLQTNDPDIYALGDAIEVKNPILNQNTIIPLAGPANKQGRIVADNIVFGNIKTYSGTIGTAIAKVFDLTVASSGLTEKILKKEKIDYIASIIHASSHAGYYPNALPMTIKILFDKKTGVLYGAQIAGYDGVDKRIDVLASMIQQKKTVYDLTEFEHSYAPPYSSAKDPVNIAGFVAENILKNQVKIIHWDEIPQLHQDEVFFLDVRTKEESALGTIEGAVNICVDELRNKLSLIPKNKKIIVFCGVGLRAYVACRILMQNGFDNVYNLSGGYKIYELAMQKQDNRDIFEGYSIGLDDLIHNKPEEKKEGITKQIKVNACGLQCPGPIMKVKNSIETIKEGDQLLVEATDPGFFKDIEAWARVTGNKLLKLETQRGIIQAIIEKRSSSLATVPKESTIQKAQNMTIIVFNNDLDKVIAAFVLANGAIAMGQKPTLFFTFWGLNAIRKPKNTQKISKTFLEKMFGFMMPKGSKKLSLSKMNFGGFGVKLIRGIMKKKNIASLEEMIESALKGGARLIACQMSMDVMGIKKEELIDGVEIGGVAMYLEASQNAATNLFI